MFCACDAGDRCFDRCPGGASNSSSPCWIACYYNAMLGPKSSTGFGGPSSSFLKGHMPIPALQTVRVSPSSSLSPLHTHFLSVPAACFTHSWCEHALDHQDRLGTASQPCGSAVSPIALHCRQQQTSTRNGRLHPMTHIHCVRPCVCACVRACLCVYVVRRGWRRSHRRIRTRVAALTCCDRIIPGHQASRGMTT